MQTALEYFNGDELATNVFTEKYAIKDEINPTQSHQRLAKEFYRIEKNKFKNPLSEQEIYDMFDHYKYLVPAGSPMYGIGNDDYIVSLSNCFLVKSPYDSYSGILKSDEQFANICKRRGGVGLCLDNLRPYGSSTQNAAKSSTGIIPFMERFSNTIKEVASHGRRGASMQLISVHHPQIIDFATVKNDDKRVTGSNLSIKLSDEFLEAVNNDTEYELRFPIDKTQPRIISKMVSAREVWNTIIHNAWLRAEPGLLFWDTVQRETPADCYDRFASKGTNPCSELNLSELDSCRLMSLNLFSFVDNPFTKNASFNFDLLKTISYKSQRLMDDLIDLEVEKVDKIIKKIHKDPEPIEIKKDELDMWKTIKQNCIDGRRTGLGLMGLADVFAGLNINYASKKSIELSEQIAKTLKLSAYHSSVDMAKELGSFIGYDPKAEENNPYINRIKDEDIELFNKMNKYGRRNISLLAIAPTGSISLVSQVSSGIEPLFNVSYTRRKKINDFDESTPDFVDKEGIKWKNYEVIHPKINLWKNITEESDISKSPWFNCTADKIKWEDRIKIQSVLQKHIDHSISSTINLPNDVTEDVVAGIYNSAWKAGLKGITVYRDGCRLGVLVKDIIDNTQRHAKKRPKELKCDIYHINVTKKLDKIRTFNYLVALGLLDGAPYEIFAIENNKHDKKTTTGNIIRHNQGKYDIKLDNGEIITDITNDTTDQEDSLTRMVSLSLRHGVPINYIMEQLSKVKGEMLCFAKSISRSLKKYIKDGTKSAENCSNCGLKLIYENGCFICKNCGNSRC